MLKKRLFIPVFTFIFLFELLPIFDSITLPLSITSLSPSKSLIAKPLELDVQAESAILMNAETGAILYEKNSKKKQYPASVTKIATTAYALSVRDNKLDKKIVAERDAVATISDAEIKRSNYTLPAYWLQPGTTHIGIKVGEELTLKDLLHGIMLPSGGDASNVVAQYIGGTIPTFMELVNEYLQQIGCHDTLFKNPHGLHHPDHQTTAYDMGLLTCEALKNPIFRDIVKTTQYPRPETNKQKATTLVQTNKLLRKGKYYYPKAIGVKTGYTSAAQHCLVSAAKDGDRTLVAVLLRCNERDTLFLDARKMFEKAFNEQKEQRVVLRGGRQRPMLNLENSDSLLKTYVKNDVCIEYFPAEEPTVKCLLHWDELSLPVEQDQKVGVLAFVDEMNQTLISEPIFAENRVDYHLMYKVKNALSGKTFILGLFIILLFFGARFVLRRN